MQGEIVIPGEQGVEMQRSFRLGLAGELELSINLTRSVKNWRRAKADRGTRRQSPRST